MYDPWCDELESEFNILADEDCQHLYNQEDDKRSRLFSLLDTNNILSLSLYRGRIYDGAILHVKSTQVLDSMLSKGLKVDDQYLDVLDFKLVKHLYQKGVINQRDFEDQKKIRLSTISQLEEDAAFMERNVYLELEDLIAKENPILIEAFNIMIEQYPEILEVQHPLVQTITEMDLIKIYPFFNIQGIDEVAEGYTTYLQRALLPVKLRDQYVADLKQEMY